MKKQEAIENFKMALEGKKREFSKEYKEMCRMAIEALEKQMEKPLEPPKAGNFDYKGSCPICGNIILHREKYCSQCGQKVSVIKA